MYFTYGEKEITYLKEKDPILGVCIDKIGMIEREVDDDLFSSVVHHIVGQQISTKAQATIWKRIQNELGTIDAEHVVSAGIEKLQSLGISFRKAGYIMDFEWYIITERSHRSCSENTSADIPHMEALPVCICGQFLVARLKE